MADILAPVLSKIDQALREHLEALRNIDEDPDTIGSEALLGGWTMVTHWIDASDGESWYFPLSSEGLPPHSRMGLLSIGQEIEAG